LAGKIDKEELHDKLHLIQDDLGYNKHRSLKCVWFRFFKEDVLSSTINNIYFDLKGATNNKYIRECMQIAIDNPKGLQIHYS
jgi:hypothetical protein